MSKIKASPSGMGNVLLAVYIMLIIFWLVLEWKMGSFR